MSLFIPRFCELLANSCKKQNEICKDLNIFPQKLSKWKTGYSEPNFDDIIMLANYFEVSTDYLLGISKEDDSPQFSPQLSITLPSDEKDLLNLYRQLSYEGKQRLIVRAEIMVEDTERKKISSIKEKNYKMFL